MYSLKPTLEMRRFRADLIFLYKFIHYLVDNNLRKLFIFPSSFSNRDQW